jgi:hypothetical protein
LINQQHVRGVFLRTAKVESFEVLPDGWMAFEGQEDPAVARPARHAALIGDRVRAG